jgi:octaprenyl-diphosphate synthase
VFHKNIDKVERKIGDILDKAKINDVIYSALTYIFEGGGKKIRPSLTMLCADILVDRFDFELNSEHLISSSACVELLHGASLILDDVIDNSTMRRGKPSLNVVMGNKISVISAAFLLGIISDELAKIGNIFLIRRFSEVARQMAEGQILEFKIIAENIPSYETRENILNFYYEVISKKTASLFRLSSEIPLIIYDGEYKNKSEFTAYLNQDLFFKFSELGFYFGIIFQIKDDIIDFIPDGTGKPHLKDLKEGKMTLPVILSDNFDKIKDILKKNMVDGEVPDNVCEEVFFLVKSGKGIERAEDEIKNFSRRIFGIIDEISVENSKKENLNKFVEFLIIRTS